jgi:hypothetical protein
VCHAPFTKMGFGCQRDLVTAETFLKEHYRKMPRTLLRYAIEKLPELKRQRFLKGKMFTILIDFDKQYAKIIC